VISSLLNYLKAFYVDGICIIERYNSTSQEASPLLKGQNIVERKKTIKNTFCWRKKVLYSSMVDNLKHFSSTLIETSSSRVNHQGFEDHEPGVKEDCFDAMSSQDHDLSSKYSSLQTTPFSVTDILSPFDESYRGQYSRNLDSTSHYMGPTRYLS